jgi:hypothetical protein
MASGFWSAIFLAAATTASAPLLPGWTKTADGSLSHKESNVTCPAKVAGFSLGGLEKGKDENTLGICSYTASKERTAQIRVRRYVKGAGDTPMAVTNDETLMEPGELNIVSAVRVTPMPEEERAADVVTVTVNRLLIDCIVERPLDAKPDITSEVHKLCFEFTQG